MSIPPIVSLTDAAIARVNALLQRQPSALGVRFSVKKGGCAGQEYVVDYVEGTPTIGDQCIEIAPNVRVYIAAHSILFLIGSKIDFSSTPLRSGFIFTNPQQTAACGCGESVQLVPQKEV